VNQKLIPHNGHKHIQEEREVEVGRLAFVSEIAKPYHMHNSTQSKYTFITLGFTII